MAIGVETLSLLQGAGLLSPRNNPQQAAFIQAMNQSHAKQALAVISKYSGTDAPNETTATLRDKLTTYFETMLGGGSGSSSEKASVTTPELDGLVQRTIHGTLPYGDKQAFISEVVRDFQNVADADRAAFLKDAAQRLVQQEIDSTNRSEPTPAEISRLEDFYEGMVAGLEAAAGLGLGGGGGSSLVDLFA